MRKLKILLARLCKENSGQDMVEYCLLAAFVAVASASGAATIVSPPVKLIFELMIKLLTAASLV